MNHLAETLILAMLTIVFLQSGIDKITDWKGNLEWLKSHFSKTFIANQVPLSLGMILAMEIVSGLLSFIGLLSLLINGNTHLALLAGIFSAVTFLFLFFGQRIAKDYVGAQTIIIYLTPTVFMIYLLSNL